MLTAADFVRGEPFVMYLGDNVLLEGIARFVAGSSAHRPDAQIFLARVPEPEHFGVVVLEGDRVVRLVEKPKEFVSDLALVGVYLFDDSILEACESLEPSWRGEYEITEAIQWLIDQGRTVRAEMRRRLVEGHRAGPRTCSRPTACCSPPREPGSTATSTRPRRWRGGRGRARREGRPLDRDRAGRRSAHGCLVEDSTVGPDVSLEPAAW